MAVVHHFPTTYSPPSWGSHQLLTIPFSLKRHQDESEWRELEGATCTRLIGDEGIIKSWQGDSAAHSSPHSDATQPHPFLEAIYTLSFQTSPLGVFNRALANWKKGVYRKVQFFEPWKLHLWLISTIMPLCLLGIWGLMGFSLSEIGLCFVM